VNKVVRSLICNRDDDPSIQIVQQCGNNSAFITAVLQYDESNRLNDQYRAQPLFFGLFGL
jgi:hypothetical protein